MINLWIVVLFLSLCTVIGANPTVDLMQDPRLPPELEYEVFLAAFQENFGDFQRLMLVAKRVHDWYSPSCLPFFLRLTSRSLVGSLPKPSKS